MKCPACQHDNEASALFCHPLTETATRLAGNLGAVNEIFAEIGQCDFLACANDWGAVSDAATDTSIGKITALCEEIGSLRRNRASWGLNSNGVSRNRCGKRRPFSPAWRGTLALRGFCTRRYRAFGPVGAKRHRAGCQASLASVRKGICRQPGSFRLGNGACGGARANGLKAGVAGASRRSRCARIFLIAIGSSMLANPRATSQ